MARTPEQNAITKVNQVNGSFRFILPVKVKRRWASLECGFSSFSS